MHWSDLERGQPRLARLGHERLIAPGVLLVATIRRDGTPRLSPVEPLLLDGDLWLSMMWQSTKARDLLRDPRVLVHSVITSREGTAGEFKVRGTARAETDPAVQRRYAGAVAASLDWARCPASSTCSPSTSTRSRSSGTTTPAATSSPPCGRRAGSSSAGARRPRSWASPSRSAT